MIKKQNAYVSFKKNSETFLISIRSELKLTSEKLYPYINFGRELVVASSSLDENRTEKRLQLSILNEDFLSPTMAPVQLRLAESTQLHSVIFRNELAGEEKVFNYNVPTQEIIFYPQSFPFAINSITLVSAEVQPEIIEIQQSPVVVDIKEPLPMALADTLLWDASLWRQPEWEIFALEGVPGSFLIRFLTYEEQSSWLKRLAFFVEKKDSHGQILTLEKLKNRHGWNAHDYQSEDLARFYNTAREKKIELSVGENKLRTVLLNLKVIHENNGKLEASYNKQGGQYNVISVANDSYPELRKRLLKHEFVHALYFSFPDLRLETQRAFFHLDPQSQKAFKAYLSLSNYDTTNNFLVYNEFLAYLFQQDSLKNSFLYRSSYFLKQLDSDKRIGDDLASQKPVLEQAIFDILGRTWQSFFPHSNW